MDAACRTHLTAPYTDAILVRAQRQHRAPILAKHVKTMAYALSNTIGSILRRYRRMRRSCNLHSCKVSKGV